MALSKDAPLLVDLRIFPERPATMNTPEPERLSVVAVLSLELELPDESSLPPQEMMVEAKPAINHVYKILFIKFLKEIMRSKLKFNLNSIYNRITFSHPDNYFSLPFLLVDVR